MSAILHFNLPWMKAKESDYDEEKPKLNSKKLGSF